MPITRREVLLSPSAFSGLKATLVRPDLWQGESKARAVALRPAQTIPPGDETKDGTQTCRPDVSPKRNYSGEGKPGRTKV
jgi:hypothetical protein